MANPTRILVPIPTSRGCKTGALNGGGTQYVIETPSGVNYWVYRDMINSDASFSKSLDGGVTWSNPVALRAMTSTQIAVWYDRWSGIDGDLIHVVYTDNSGANVYYRSINTANSDTLSTEYTVFDGASTANGGAISIARMRGGNLVVVGTIDVNTEVFSKKSIDVGVNWSNIAAGYETGSTISDLCIVMPGWGADTNDAMMFYYDKDASEISVKYYDDSVNSWSETSIATSISKVNHTDYGYLWDISAAVDLTNSQNLLVFWTGVDAANADLRCFKVTQSAQTETAANVVLNSIDDQSFCNISIAPNDDWYVFYAGKSDGSDVYNSSMGLYYKISTDDGATWSTEAQLEPNLLYSIFGFYGKPRHYLSIGILLVQNYDNSMCYNAPLSISHVKSWNGVPVSNVKSWSGVQ
jgi:hypothetical protein